MTHVVFECTDHKDLPADHVDGSNELLRPADQVKAEDHLDPYAGLLRRVIDARRARTS